jgi:hypothetical protein
MMKMNLKTICKYIQENDKNGDIMDAYQEMLNGELPENTLIEICQNILGGWKEDIFDFGTPTNREIQIYSYLGL